QREFIGILKAGAEHLTSEEYVMLARAVSARLGTSFVHADTLKEYLDAVREVSRSVPLSGAQINAIQRQALAIFKISPSFSGDAERKLAIVTEFLNTPWGMRAPPSIAKIEAEQRALEEKLRGLLKKKEELTSEAKQLAAGSEPAQKALPEHGHTP
ncbi:MAG: hypothetical protein ACXVBW_07540, partial [Bdellovibrionota bacterium]